MWRGHRSDRSLMFGLGPGRKGRTRLEGAERLGAALWLECAGQSARVIGRGVWAITFTHAGRRTRHVTT